MERVKDGLKIALLASTLATLGLAGWGGWKIYGKVMGILQITEGVLGRVDGTLEDSGQLLKVYKEELESERSKKALSASLAAAASWQATARLVNVEIVPEMRETLRGIQATNRTLGVLIGDQNRELALTQGEVRGTLGSLREQVEGIGPEIGRLTTTSAETAAVGGRTLQELERSSREMTEILSNVALATESAPKMAESLEKILANGQKFQRPISILTLLIALFGALR